MQDDWLSKDFSKKWDTKTNANYPSRKEHLDILVSLIKDLYEKNSWIIDLGLGSGQVEELIFKKNPNVKIIGIDYSLPMIKLAEKRLKKYKNQYIAIQNDLENIKNIKLPNKKFQLIISVQTLHHLSDSKKIEVFKWVNKNLSKNGTFIILDRISVDIKNSYSEYRSVWKRLYKQKENNFGKYVLKMKDKDDHTITLEEHINWLEKSGFKASCLHLNFDRAVISAVKK